MCQAWRRQTGDAQYKQYNNMSVTQRVSYPVCLESRQVLHEAIREHSMEAGKRVKTEGAKNDLLDRISQDPLFEAVHTSLDELLDPALFVGK